MQARIFITFFLKKSFKELIWSIKGKREYYTTVLTKQTREQGKINKEQNEALSVSQSQSYGGVLILVYISRRKDQGMFWHC